MGPSQRYAFDTSDKLNGYWTYSVVTSQSQSLSLNTYICYGSFTKPDSDTDTDSNLDSKPNGYIVQYRTFHIAWTWTLIPTLYFCKGQESEPESVSSNVNDPLLWCERATIHTEHWSFRLHLSPILSSRLLLDVNVTIESYFWKRRCLVWIDPPFTPAIY